MGRLLPHCRRPALAVGSPCLSPCFLLLPLELVPLQTVHATYTLLQVLGGPGAPAGKRQHRLGASLTETAVEAGALKLRPSRWALAAAVA